MPVLLVLVGPAPAAPGPPADDTGAADDAKPPEEEEEEDGAIVVEGQALDAADPGRAATSVTTLPIDDRLPSGSDMADVLTRAPGTTVRRLGGLGTFSSVSLRGAALRQVEVLLDGIPLNPDGSSAVDLSALPLQAFDEVRVWRGAGPAWLAAAPLGGVVDLRTRTAARAPLTTGLTLGSWRTGQAQAHGATVAGDVEVLGAVSALTSRSDFVYYDDAGTAGRRDDDARPRRRNNGRTQIGGLLRLREGRPGDRWTGILAATARSEALPGPIGGRPEGRLTTGWGLLAAERRVTQGATALQIRPWHQLRAEHRRTEPWSVAVTPGTELLTQSGLHLSVRHALSTVVLGATGRVRHDLRLRPDDPSTTAHRVSGTAVVDLAWQPHSTVRIEPVLHQRLWHDRQRATGVTRLGLSPRLAVAWIPRDALVFHAAGGRAVRPPDFLERFGDRGAVEGRADLRPERGTWADTGVRLSGEGGLVELNGFHHHAVDRIVFIQNGQQTLVPINVGRSRTTGIEAGATGRLGAFDGRLAGTFTDSAVRSDIPGQDGKALPRIPRWTLTAEAGARWDDRARLGWTVRALAANPWDEANLRWSGRRLLHTVALDIHPGPGLPSLRVSARNAWDTLALAGPTDPLQPDAGRALRPLTDFAGYPLPGRTVLVTLRWTPRPETP